MESFRLGSHSSLPTGSGRRASNSTSTGGSSSTADASRAPTSWPGSGGHSTPRRQAHEAAADLLRRAEPADGLLQLDGEPLTSERLKVAVAAAFLANGTAADDFIVAHGEQTCIGHHMGSGAIGWGEPITIDIWPRDTATGFHTDMTRTFVVGPIADELADYHRLCLEVHEKVIPAIRPGVTGKELHTIASEVVEAGGYPSQLSKQPGEVLLDGFFHGLGHGVGLEVHEEPQLDSQRR